MAICACNVHDLLQKGELKKLQIAGNVEDMEINKDSLTFRQR